MRKLLPILLLLIGTGAGVGAGLFLMPAPAAPDAHAAVECVAPPEGTDHAAPASDPDGPISGNEYVKMHNQFVVPVLGPDRVNALVVASLSIEVPAGYKDTVFAREPKLRDAFLQVLLDHANIGGFEGNFTTGDRMEILRNALLEAATPVLEGHVSEILVTEIARQDVL